MESHYQTDQRIADRVRESKGHFFIRRFVRGERLGGGCVLGGTGLNFNVIKHMN
jgi:hypothetical protein